MKTYLFPRLNSANSKLLAEKYSQLSPLQISECNVWDALEGVTYAPTGGVKLSEDTLSSLRSELLSLAEGEGFPDARTLEAQRSFDLKLSRRLLNLPIVNAETLRDEVWAYLTCRLVPEIVAWRFGREDDDGWKTSPERLLPGVRNAFQRLWWRVAILRDPTNEEDELWLLDSTAGGLTEDNFVQLLERPGISTYRNLTQTIAHEFVRYRQFAKSTEDLSEEDLLREAMVRISRLGAFANLDAIPEEKRLDSIRNIFAERILAHGGRVPSPGRVYRGFAARQLSTVDLPSSTSNQHEIQGVKELRALLGHDTNELDCTWKLYFGDGTVRDVQTSPVKWYDARATNPNRSEWRLYYPAKKTPMEKAMEGDMVLFASLIGEDRVHAFILPKGTPIYLQVRGALDAIGVAEDVPDEIEEYLREQLHRRV